MITMFPLSCEFIQSAGYDSRLKKLVILFKNESYYLYKNVNNWVFYCLYSSDYPGMFFYDKIKEQYEYSKISESDLNDLA